MRRAALLAAAIAAAYLIAAPVSADLAAQSYRVWLFGHAGPALWDNAWYGGHPLPGYSVLFPPLGALLGVRLAGALSVVAAAALFAALVPDRVAATWFAAGIALQLLTGRMAFLLGVAIGLGALLATQRRHRAAPARERGSPAQRPARGGYAAAGIVLATLTTLASPVAGAFLALAGVAWWQRAGVALAAAAVVPGLALAVLFPEGGAEPFVASSFWPALAMLLAVALLAHGAVRRGALLAAALCLAAFAVTNPLGGNASRIGALFAGPLLVAALPAGGARRTAALAVLPVLAYWQLMPPIRDAAVSTGDPATRAAFYVPLLARLPAGDGRLEVPFTRSHWDARWLAKRVPLARGWQRQLDHERNALFYKGTLTAPRYLAWLRANAVAWVALPDAKLDASAHREAALLRAGVPGLREVWRSPDWRLWRVARAVPTGARTLTTDGFTVRGAGLVRVHWSPYWAVVEGAGCVRRARHGDWTVVTGPARRVAQRFSLSRGVRRATGDRCAPLAPDGSSG